MFFQSRHCERESKYGVISGPYFPVFGLNTELFSSPYFFVNRLNDILPQFPQSLENVFAKLILYANQIFDASDNTKTFKTSIRYILDSKRFSRSLL